MEFDKDLRSVQETRCLLRQAEGGSVELMNSIQSAEILERSAYLLEAEVFDEI